MTIFLQLSEEQYKQLIESLTIAYNYTSYYLNLIPHPKGNDDLIREEMKKENEELEKLMTVIGEQGQSQINKI